MADISAILFCVTACAALARLKTKASQRANRILHVKGFASFFDPSKCEGACRKAQEFIRELDPGVIVWDGDEFSKDSFTYAIYLDRLYSPNIRRKYRAYCLQGDASSKRFDAWRQILGCDQHFEVVQVALGGTAPSAAADYTAADYVALGTAAMKDSQTRRSRPSFARGFSNHQEQGAALDVLVIGLGPVVADEIRAASKEDIPTQVYLLDVERIHKVRGPESLANQFRADLVPANITKIDF